MIPVKIISKEEAIKKGLTKNQKQQMGRGFKGCGMVVTKEDGKKEELMETFIIDKNDKKILTFMDDKRKQELKKHRGFSKYIKQFDEIPRGLK